MLRHYDPEDKFDVEAKEELNAQDWQIELLAMNPSYTAWGPYEDYMIDDRKSWTSRQFLDSWEQVDQDGLDDLNEIVNFYFMLSRESEECPDCDETGYHPDASWVVESFYQHSSPFRSYGGPDRATVERYGDEFKAFVEEMLTHRAWHDRITQQECDVLVAQHRLPQGSVAKEVNRQMHPHDAINRTILIEERIKRLGLPMYCPRCEGRGYGFTEPEAHVSLVLWKLHPRKGCSRGIEVKRIEQKDLDSVFRYLRTAADRNAERFSRIPKEASCPQP